MTCRYAQPTDQPWFLNDPEGAKTTRCYYPEAKTKIVAGGFVRYATLNDTFDVSKPTRPQIIEGADYVSVRSCACGPKCPFYEEKENADDI